MVCGLSPFFSWWSRIYASVLREILRLHSGRDRSTTSPPSLPTAGSWASTFFLLSAVLCWDFLLLPTAFAAQRKFRSEVISGEGLHDWSRRISSSSSSFQ